MTFTQNKIGSHINTRSMMLGGASLAVMTLALVAVQNMDTKFIVAPKPVPVSLDDSTASGNGALDAELDTLLRTDRAEPLAANPTVPREPLRGELVFTPSPVETREEETPAIPQASSPASEDVRARTLGRTAGAGCVGAGCTPGAGGVPVGVPVKAMAEPKALAEAPIAEATAPDQITPTPQETGRDKFEDFETNPVKVTAEDPVSTFSVDVDTASYSFMRAALNNGVLPQKDSVRVEELINYFDYNYAGPDGRETPFATHVTVMPTPWNTGTELMRIGIKGYELKPAEKPRSNLVFLLDTSGSMNQPNKLPLLINSFRLLVENMAPNDTVSIVVYAGSAGTVLEPTKVSEKSKILGALERLRAGGSTAGGEGIRQAYRLAEQNFDKDGINRVLLATDGDFNVGITNPEELQDFVERKRDTGVYLSVLGFGRGNYNDQLMQTLAQNGNGNAAYIDTLGEARKILVEEAASTLFPIAKDVKIQVEFNPAAVAEYRLIGYETRALRREDFNNDKVDAGEIGAGHRVTALYEITPVGGTTQVDPLRYGSQPASKDMADEMAFVKIRYKQPDADKSQLITRPVTQADRKAPDTEARFAASVAAFAQLLRGGRHTGEFTYADVIELANSAKGDDPFGYRTEFVNLVRLAETAPALPRQ
ncbi:MAG: von Willebrand factor type A domain-containing protein [Paracoccaceae bacterium]